MDITAVICILSSFLEETVQPLLPTNYKRKQIINKHRFPNQHKSKLTLQKPSNNRKEKMEPYKEATHRKLIPTRKINMSKTISIDCTIETKITLISKSNSDKEHT